MENNWKIIKSEIQNMLIATKLKLNSVSAESVQFYLDHDEYEMAFEILFTELIRINKIISIDYNKSIEIGKQLNLDKETVYDPDFWNKLIQYYGKE